LGINKKTSSLAQKLAKLPEVEVTAIKPVTYWLREVKSSHENKALYDLSAGSVHLACKPCCKTIKNSKKAPKTGQTKTG
jgi:hypothetical protein